VSAIVVIVVVCFDGAALGRDARSPMDGLALGVNAQVRLGTWPSLYGQEAGHRRGYLKLSCT